MATLKNFSGTDRIFEDLPTVTMAVGNTTSTIANISKTTLCGILPDLNITDLSINIQLSYDGINFFDYIKNDGATPPVASIIPITLIAGKWLGLNATDFNGAQYIRIVAATPTPQATQDSVITLICRGTPA